MGGSGEPVASGARGGGAGSAPAQLPALTAAGRHQLTVPGLHRRARETGELSDSNYTVSHRMHAYNLWECFWIHVLHDTTLR